MWTCGPDDLVQQQGWAEFALELSQKNGPAGPIFNENLAQADHFWLTKNGLPGLTLATKSNSA